jgi:hypothetical protein
MIPDQRRVDDMILKMVASTTVTILSNPIKFWSYVGQESFKRIIGR